MKFQGRQKDFLRGIDLCDKPRAEKIDKTELFMTMRLKKIRFSLLVVIINIIIVACNTATQRLLDIHGDWIETKKGNILLRIDSAKKTISIDYSVLGEEIFTSKYEINANNEITADILPKGARIEMEKNGIIKFYPVQKGYNRDIESVYFVTFKRQQKK